MKKKPLKESPYSCYHNVLTNLGGWVLETTNPRIRNVYLVFQTFMISLSCLMCVLLFIDLYLVFGDIKKMTWNICISAFFLGWFTKHLYTLHRWNTVNRLRKKLHQKETYGLTPEDERLNKLSVRQLKIVEFVFYISVIFVIPVWLISWYFGLMWGERGIPIPIWIPFEVDFRDDFQFHIVFTVGSILGVTAVIFVMSVELAMFTILIQISREYERLIKDFSKINDLFEDGDFEDGKSVKDGQETNPYLREIKIKKNLKEFSIRQQQLLEYTREFELIYRYPTLLQLLSSSVLLTVCALQCIMEGRISLNVVYVMGYLGIILIDMLMFCWFSTRIRFQCFSVGDAAYSVLWYRMDVKIQKDIKMIIMRSQHPPEITAGKMMRMDLHTFMIMIKNIYSWLTLFQHLALTADN